MMNEKGPSWKDVTDEVHRLNMEYWTDVRIELKLAGKTGSFLLGLAVEVSGEATTVAKAKAWRQEIFAEWPTHRHRTMPGLLLGMLHQWEERLLERAEAKELTIHARG